LTGKHKNLCVVGDDDQSIYRFRGADISNILNFEKDFPNVKVIKLEQNYRSTSNILGAAGAVVSRNLGRKKKELWTEKRGGEKILCYKATDEKDEARYICRTIQQQIDDGRSLREIAILYRTNAQSRALEDALRDRGIPYRIFGGLRFYDRKEIKDIMYLHCAESSDIVSLRRIINVPPAASATRQPGKSGMRASQPLWLKWRTPITPSAEAREFAPP
jgi:DNA helicase-2/ATP-dependent DNA helicase PcrA